MEAEDRRAARLLLDAQGRVLLFRHADPSGNEFWATPGGGVEPHESFAEAARREAMEELGLQITALEPAGARDAEFRSGHRLIRQHEEYFRIRVDTRGLERVVTSAHAEERILETRWWSPDEIEATSDRVWPADLASRVRAILAEDFR